VQFVGFMGAWRSPGPLEPLTAGVIASLITTWVTFAPCFLFIFTGAPFIEYLRTNPRLGAVMQGIMAAVVGVMLNLALWFARHTLVVSGSPDWVALAIATGALVAMFRFRVGLLPVLGGAALVGALAKLT
jgi:chromate transporter